MVLIYRHLLEEELKEPADTLGEKLVLIYRHILKEGLKEPADTLGK